MVAVTLQGLVLVLLLLLVVVAAAAVAAVVAEAVLSSVVFSCASVGDEEVDEARTAEEFATPNGNTDCLKVCFPLVSLFPFVTCALAVPMPPAPVAVVMVLVAVGVAAGEAAVGELAGGLVPSLATFFLFADTGICWYAVGWAVFTWFLILA